MPTPEQIAALVAPLVVQPVVELVTKAVKQILIEERSLLAANLVDEVNSHLTETLRLYFEERMANQKQEFDLELQTKIDELKFQHYQQLERLGQAVEDVMTFSPNNEIDDEILEEISDEILDELDEFDRAFDGVELIGEMESDRFEINFETNLELESLCLPDSDDLSLFTENSIPDLFSNDFSSDFNVADDPDRQSDRPETLTKTILEENFESSEWGDISSDSSDPFTDLSNQELMSESDRLTAQIEDTNLEISISLDDLDLFTDSSALDFLNAASLAGDSVSDRSETELNGSKGSDEDITWDRGAIIPVDDLEDFEFDRPEIVYEGEGYESPTDLTKDLTKDEELDRKLGELSEADFLNIELESLDFDSELKRERELSSQFPQNFPEIEDDELSEFADLEAEKDFWGTDTALSPSSLENVWHLGIDFGYSAIRACLFDRVTDRVYPLNFNGEGSIATSIEIMYGGEAIAIQGFKQFLRLGIPYRLQNHWQPTVQWTKDRTLNLKDLQISTQELLVQIKSASHPQLSDISNIMANLETVILGHPHSWSDAYTVNLKEAVLGSGLVDNIDQVLVIDQAIALMFPSLDDSKNLQLILDGGAFTTTLSFKSSNSAFKSDFNSKKYKFSNLEYAGLGINQDIILQLLHPKAKDKLPATKFIVPGASNPEHRTNLQQFLLDSAIGIEALVVAEQIKLFFSEQPASIWEGNLGGKSLKISRSELEVKVIQPFIQSLNDACDRLISGHQPEDITQIAIGGGTMRLPSIVQWLEAKFANAQVLRLPDSNLAQGLAIAPKYSEYLDINRHQYSDYFLLSEICNLNLQEPLSLGSLNKKLQNRGVNPKACGDRLARILSGQLPGGILPWQEPEKSIILADPYLDPQILAANLFTPLPDNLYMPNPSYTQLLGAYLKMLDSHTHQSFSEPSVFPSFVI